MSLNAIIRLVFTILMLVIGWSVRGWFDDSKALAAAEAAAKERESFVARESLVATKVEERLADLKANERVIERETIKLVDRPVYRRDCIDDDGLRLIEGMARGSAAAEPAGKVPDGAAGADGKDRR